MIITVTPNPSLDRALEVDHLAVGEVNRAHAVHVDAGGKGINVSRALVRQGIDSLAVLPVGGVDGARLVSLRQQLTALMTELRLWAESGAPATQLSAPDSYPWLLRIYQCDRHGTQLTPCPATSTPRTAATASRPAQVNSHGSVLRQAGKSTRATGERKRLPPGPDHRATPRVAPHAISVPGTSTASA